MLQQTSVPYTFFVSSHTVQTKHHTTFSTSTLSSLILLCNLFSNLILNGCHFVKNHLKLKQKRSDFEWSAFRMVGTIAIAIAKAQQFETKPFEIRPSKSPNFKWSDFRSPLQLDDISQICLVF